MPQQPEIHISRVEGFSDEKGKPDYWLDAVKDFWVETGLPTDVTDLEIILNWFDLRRAQLKDNEPITATQSLLQN